MSGFLAPLNYDRARDVLRRLSVYAGYSEQGAAQAAQTLRQYYPLVFRAMDVKTFANGAMLMEMAGADVVGPLVFVSHLDAPACEVGAGEGAMTAPLSRAHVITLLEALEGLLSEGYRPGGDLIIAISMDGLSGGAGAADMAAHLKARGVQPCFVLDYGGYATMESFRTYLPQDAPLALIGLTEKGEVHGTVTARSKDGVSAAVAAVRVGARMTRLRRRPALCDTSKRMLEAIAKNAPILQRWLVKKPEITFPLMCLSWWRRSVFRQFFASEREVCAVQAEGSAHAPAAQATLTFRRTLTPGRSAADSLKHVRRMARGMDVRADVALDASTPSLPEGEAWDALCTAIEIQFERVVIAPCLSPFVCDGRFYAPLGGRVYRFSPFMVTGREALRALCTVTDGTLQTAVQFFRSMLSV